MKKKRNEAERRNLTDWTECVFIVLTTIKKHGTNYSYGEFVAQIAARKIKPLGLYD